MNDTNLSAFNHGYPRLWEVDIVPLHLFGTQKTKKMAIMLLFWVRRSANRRSRSTGPDCKIPRYIIVLKQAVKELEAIADGY
jgi:hypothetical protein